jgi:hypothetical protein
MDINKLKDGYIYFKTEITNLERQKKIRLKEIENIDYNINRLFFELSKIVSILENEKDFDFKEFLENTKDI